MRDVVSGSLTEALGRHDINLPAEQIERLDQYCRLLWDWNARLNLTRHTDYDRFVSRDVIDSLQLAALIDPGEQVLDVGTGGGVPGIILAIVRPDLKLTLCESVTKKARAVEAMIHQLDLPVVFFASRAEDLLDDCRFDVLVARAVGPLWQMLKWFEPHWPSIGRLLAVKGPRWLEERKAARERGLLKNLELRKAASYPMPGTQSQSVILKIWSKQTGQP